LLPFPLNCENGKKREAPKKKGTEGKGEKRKKGEEEKGSHLDVLKTLHVTGGGKKKRVGDTRRKEKRRGKRGRLGI